MPVRAVADAEMHGAQSFFLAAHIERARRAVFVRADRRLAADAPGILVAVFLEIVADISGFVFSVDALHPAVFDRKLDRILPASVRHVRRGIPDDRAVGGARNRFDVNLTPGPSAAVSRPVFLLI